MTTYDHTVNWGAGPDQVLLHHLFHRGQQIVTIAVNGATVSLPAMIGRGTTFTATTAIATPHAARALLVHATALKALKWTVVNGSAPSKKSTLKAAQTTALSTELEGWVR